MKRRKWNWALLFLAIIILAKIGNYVNRLRNEENNHKAIEDIQTQTKNESASADQVEDVYNRLKEELQEEEVPKKYDTPFKKNMYHQTSLFVSFWFEVDSSLEYHRKTLGNKGIKETKIKLTDMGLKNSTQEQLKSYIDNKWNEYLDLSKKGMDRSNVIITKLEAELRIIGYIFKEYFGEDYRPPGSTP